MTSTRGSERYQDPTPVNEPTHNPSSNARLSPEVVTTLRDALRHWVDGDGTNDSNLGDVLHAVASEARDRGVRAEELLVMLKTTWLEVGGPPPSSHSTSPSSHKRLDELVTTCIKAYYE